MTMTIDLATALEERYAWPGGYPYAFRIGTGDACHACAVEAIREDNGGEGGGVDSRTIVPWIADNSADDSRCDFGWKCDHVELREGFTAEGSPLARIRFTATIVTPDGSDTNVYGDPCEPGYGAIMEDGWWNPDWSPWEVWPEPESSKVIFVDGSDVDDYLQWFAETPMDRAEALRAVVLRAITEELGALDSFDGVTAYAADSLTHYGTGADVLPAAHVEWFASDSEGNHE